MGGLGGGLTGNAGLSDMSALGGAGGMSGLSGLGGTSGLDGTSGLGGTSALGGMSPMGGMSGMPGAGGLGGMMGAGGGSQGIMGMIMQILTMMMSMISSLLGGGMGGQGAGAGAGSGGGDPTGGAGGQDPTASGGGAPAPSAGAPSGTAGTAGSAGDAGQSGGDSGAGNAGFAKPGSTAGTPYSDSQQDPNNDPTQTYAGGYGNPPSNTPAPGGAPSPGEPPSNFQPSSVQGNQIKLFGGSQSGENNIKMNNKTSKDKYVLVQKNLDPGEKDPGATVFKIPAGKDVNVNAVDDKGLRFQEIDPTTQMTPQQKSQVDSKGTVDGVTVPPTEKTNTLYETNYVSAKHLSYDDISPLDGAKTPLRMSGNGGRTEEISQEVLANAPGRTADGHVPGVGPDASSTGNAAKNPELRDYYAKTSQNGNGTRKFYYNSSVGGDADQANVSYTGKQGMVRTSVDLG